MTRTAAMFSTWQRTPTRTSYRPVNRLYTEACPVDDCGSTLCAPTRYALRANVEQHLRTAHMEASWATT